MNDSVSDFITIKEDVDGRIAAARKEILDENRTDITSELFKDEDFKASTDSLHSSLRVSSEQISDDEEAKLRHIQEKTRDLVSNTTFIHLDTESKEKLDQISEIFFHLGKEALPIYASYVANIKPFLEHIGYTQNPALLYSGRDSFPFMLSAKERDELRGIHQVYAPFNRLNSRQLFDKESKQRMKFISDIRDFYKKNDIFDAQLVISDFGFNGTIERLHRVLLYPEGGLHQMHHFVFSKGTYNDPRFEANLKKVATLGFDTSIDAAYKANVYGYQSAVSNRIEDDDFSYIAGHSERSAEPSWHQEVYPFLHFLQEIGSGVNESRQDSLRRGDEKAFKGTHYKFASAQALTAHYAYLQSLSYYLKNSDSAHASMEDLQPLAIERIKNLFGLFKNNRKFFNEFMDIPDRVGLGFSPITSGHQRMIGEDLKNIRAAQVTGFTFAQE